MCEDTHQYILSVLCLTKQGRHLALLEVSTKVQSSRIIKVKKDGKVIVATGMKK